MPLEHVGHPSGAVVGLLNRCHGGSNRRVLGLIPPLTCRLDKPLVGFVQNCSRQPQAKAIYQILGPAELDMHLRFEIMMARNSSLARSNPAKGETASAMQDCHT